MKKITKIFMVCAVLLGTIAMTGCGLNLEETYDTWYKYDREVDLPVANADASDSDADGVLKNAQIFVRFNPNDGLEILVCTTKTQTISYLGGAYTVDADVTTGGSKVYGPSEFGTGKWKLLMLLARFKEEEPPTITVNLDNVLDGQFNLKRVLAEFILNNLLA